MSKFKQIFIYFIAFACLFFHIYLVYADFLPNMLIRSAHVMFALVWIYLFLPSKNKFEKFAGYILFACSFVSAFYVLYFNEMLSDQYGSLEGKFQYFVAFSLILAILEMARRSIKLALPLTAFFILLYGFFGHLMPGSFSHQEIPLESFLGTLSITEGGIFGQLTGVSVLVVSIFVILGAFVGVGEGGSAFMSISTKLAGRLNGGAAKVSILASAFFGSISGSASANVASTGAFTIPTMKRLGYPPAFAASVEAVASTGGQIMPPLMGAGAFIMADLLGVRYTVILAAALFPAILFFLCVWIGINIFAKKFKLLPLGDDEIPNLSYVLKISPFFLIPFGSLLVLMLYFQKTPQYSASVAIFLSIGLLFFDRDWKFSAERFLNLFLKASVLATKQIAMIASIIICAGIIIGVLNITGIGVKITSAILYLSNGNIYATLFLTAIACLILGMEVPTTAAYIICASVCVPILTELNLDALSAHLFIFWFSLLSTITPPVCGTVFIASGIAEANWIEVAKNSIRLGIGLYLIPLSFISNQSLIMLQTQPLMAILAFIKILIGLFLISNITISQNLTLTKKTIILAISFAFLFVDIGL